MLAQDHYFQLNDILKSRYCKSQSQLIECFEALVISVSQNFFETPSGQVILESLTPVLIEFVSSQDWATKRSAIACIAQLAQGQISCKGLVNFKASIKQVLNETRSDKIKPVRDITSKALTALRQVPENKQYLATFSPNQLRTSETDVDLMINIQNLDEDIVPSSQIKMKRPIMSRGLPPKRGSPPRMQKVKKERLSRSFS